MFLWDKTHMSKKLLLSGTSVRCALRLWWSLPPHANSMPWMLDRAMIRNKQAEAFALMEKHALMGVKPLSFELLCEWYTDCKQPSKAQDAQERGVVARHPPSVVQYIRYSWHLGLKFC
jgi:hypothetical protein